MYDSDMFLPYISDAAGSLALLLLSLALCGALLANMILSMILRRCGVIRNGSFAYPAARWVSLGSMALILAGASLWYVFGLLPSEFARVETARAIADVFQVAHRQKGKITAELEGVRSLLVSTASANDRRINASVKVVDLAGIFAAIKAGQIPKGDIDWGKINDQVSMVRQ
jgi:hypothetical protein